MQWHCSAIPFPAGVHAQWNCKWIPHSCAKAWNSLLQKAVSLSIRISCGGPCSKNTASSWRITLAESCLSNCFQMEKHDGPQSVSVKKWQALLCVMSIPSLCQFLFTPSFPFTHWIGAWSMDWDSSYAWLNSCFCYCWANSLDKIGSVSHSWVSTTSVDSHDFSCI